MASRLDGAKALTWLAAVALAALGWWFGSGLRPLWWLTWLAPLPVLWLAPRVRRLWAALAAFAAFGLGGLNQWGYLHTAIGLPLPTVVYAIALPGVAFALCVLLYRRLLVRGHPLAATCAMPATWIAIEYFNNLTSPHGTFGNIAYTQMEALPILQVAAVTGIWGIGFLVLLVPASLAVQTAPSCGTRGRRWSAGLTALLVIAAVAFGSWRLQVPAESSLRIGLVSLEKPVRPALSDADGQLLQRRYVDAIAGLAKAGARMLVIPETSFATSATTVPALAALAKQYGIAVAAGIDFKGDPRAERNMLMVFSPASASPATYSKHHLIPGFESQYTPGDTYTMLAGAPRTGLAICKDMDFLDIGHAYAARQAQLLLVPAWDFGIDGWLHGRMAIMRGVESGFAIARAARTGRLTLSDDRGRVIAEASSEQHDATLLGELPLHNTRTLYARWGDWFAWLDLMTLLGCLALALWPRRAAHLP